MLPLPAEPLHLLGANHYDFRHARNLPNRFAVDVLLGEGLLTQDRQFIIAGLSLTLIQEQIREEGLDLSTERFVVTVDFTEFNTIDSEADDVDISLAKLMKIAKNIGNYFGGDDDE